MRKFLRIAIIAAGLGTLPVLAQDATDEEDGGGFLENMIESRLSSDGFQVRVRGFEGALSSRATVAQIQISDEDGPWLTVNDAVLDWNRSALLRGRLQVEELTAGEILLPRLPEGEEQADIPTPEAKPFSLPELPVSINIDQINAQRIELGPTVIGEEVALSLTGSTRLADGEGEVDIQADRLDGEEGSFRIAGSYENDSGELMLDLAVEEGPDGIVATLIALPGRPALTVGIEGSGPLSDFDAQIALATDGEPRLEGSVALREQDDTLGFAVDLGGDVTALFLPTYRPFFGPNVQLKATGAKTPDGGFDLSELDLSARALTLQGAVRVGADGVPDFIDVTGEIASEDGPVLLPAGGEIRVDRVGLDVNFDASQGEDWTGDLVIEGLDQPGLEAERVALEGGGQIAGSGETLEVAAGFDFVAAGLALDDGGLGEALGNQIDGRIDLGYRAGEPIVLDTLRMSGAGFSLDGSGEVDPDGENVPLGFTAQLDADDLSVFSALSGRPLTGGASVDLDLTAEALSGAFDVTVDGRAQDLSVDMEQLDPLLAGPTLLVLDATRDETGLTLRDLSLENDALDLSASADLTSDGGTARADLRVDDLARIDDNLDGPATLTFTAARPDDEWTIDLVAEGADARVAGNTVISDLEASSPLAQFDLDVNAADLSNFSVFAGRELGGSVNLATEGQARLDASEAEVTLSGDIADVRIDQEEVDRLLAGSTVIDARVERDGDRIAIPRMRVDNQQITAVGEGVIAPGNSDVNAQIALADLSQIVDAMSGPANIVLDASETAEGWVIDLDGEGAESRVIADVTVSDLGSEDTAPLVAGTAQVTAEDLSLFSAIADRELGGSVDLSIEGQARTDLSTANANVAGRTTELRVGQPEVDNVLAGVTELDIDAEKEGDRLVVPSLSLSNPQISVDGNVRYGTDDGVVEARIRMPELGTVVPEMSGPGEVTLFAEQTGDAWQVSVDGSGAGAEVDVLGQVSDIEATPLFDGDVSLQVADLSRFRRIANRPLSGSVSAEASGNVRVDASRFDMTANVRANGLRVGVEQADQILAGGSTTLSADVSRDGADAPIRVQRLDLDSPGLDATANGAILGGASDLTFDARLANLGQFVEGLNGPLTARGQAGQSGGNVTLNVDLTGPEGITATVSGSVAETFDTANLNVTGGAPLRLANPFLTPRSLTGGARFDLALNGPLAPTSVTGTVTISDGRLVDPGLPLILNDLQGTARLQGNQAQLNFTANKQDGGSLRLAGPVSLQSGYDADLAIEIGGLVFEDPRLYRTRINGRVTIVGPLTGGATIGGDIRLGETEVRIPSTGLGVTGPIPDNLVHLNEPSAVRRTRENAGLIEEPGSGGSGGGGVAFPLDLTITADNQVFVRGRGLDAELGGSLNVGGTTANVIPSGQFDLIRGRMDILGKRLVLDEGQITLQGNFDPRIRLVARTDANDVTVLIVVEGQATEPDIAFRSEPELPEDEVLARLLFGKSIDNISPLQAAQLASAVATLAGRGGDGIVANLRKSTGLDDLDVTTDEDGNVGVRAGKYISENVYTDVEVDSEGEAQINLNLDVSESLTVRGGANNTGETSLGIFFERDY